MKVRKGDIVTVQIRVTDVADYSSAERPEGQQVMGQMLPRGERVGWLVPQEAEFTLAQPSFRVGDRVKVTSNPLFPRGKVVALAADHLWVVLDDGRWATWEKVCTVRVDEDENNESPG